MLATYIYNRFSTILFDIANNSTQIYAIPSYLYAQLTLIIQCKVLLFKLLPPWYAKERYLVVVHPCRPHHQPRNIVYSMAHSVTSVKYTWPRLFSGILVRLEHQVLDHVICQKHACPHIKWGCDHLALVFLVLVHGSWPVSSVGKTALNTEFALFLIELEWASVNQRITHNSKVL